LSGRPGGAVDLRNPSTWNNRPEKRTSEGGKKGPMGRRTGKVRKPKTGKEPRRKKRVAEQDLGKKLETSLLKKER